MACACVSNLEGHSGHKNEMDMIVPSIQIDYCNVYLELVTIPVFSFTDPFTPSALPYELCR